MTGPAGGSGRGMPAGGDISGPSALCCLTVPEKGDFARIVEGEAMSEAAGEPAEHGETRHLPAYIRRTAGEVDPQAPAADTTAVHQAAALRGPRG